MSSEPRAHHFVPQCWLAGFTETGRKDGRLFVTDLRRRKQWSSSPGNVGHRRDFYRVSGSEMDPVAFEKMFSRVEDVLAPILRNLYEEPTNTSDEQMDALLRFAAIQYIRVPAFRSILFQISDSIYGSLISKALESPGCWAKAMKKAGISIDLPGASYEEMIRFKREVVQAGKYSLSANNEFFLVKGLIVGEMFRS